MALVISSSSMLTSSASTLFLEGVLFVDNFLIGDETDLIRVGNGIFGKKKDLFKLKIYKNQLIGMPPAVGSHPNSKVLMLNAASN